MISYGFMPKKVEFDEIINQLHTCQIRRPTQLQPRSPIQRSLQASSFWLTNQYSPNPACILSIHSGPFITRKRRLKIELYPHFLSIVKCTARINYVGRSFTGAFLLF